jgi:hypothetical protein
VALFHYCSLGQWESIATGGTLEYTTSLIPFEIGSTALRADHTQGQANIFEVVYAAFIVRKSIEEVFE